MIDKFPKSIQGLIYQYSTGQEVLALERVCKKVSAGARQDYIWRYLTENTLEMTRSKIFGDSWKHHYLRNFKAGEFMTREKFNFMM